MTTINVDPTVMKKALLTSFFEVAIECITNAQLTTEKFTEEDVNIILEQFYASVGAVLFDNTPELEHEIYKEDPEKYKAFLEEVLITLDNYEGENTNE